MKSSVIAPVVVAMLFAIATSTGQQGGLSSPRTIGAGTTVINVGNEAILITLPPGGTGTVYSPSAVINFTSGTTNPTTPTTPDPPPPPVSGNLRSKVKALTLEANDANTAVRTRQGYLAFADQIDRGGFGAQGTKQDVQDAVKKYNDIVFRNADDTSAWEAWEKGVNEILSANEAAGQSPTIKTRGAEFRDIHDGIGDAIDSLSAEEKEGAEAFNVKLVIRLVLALIHKPINFMEILDVVQMMFEKP